MIGEKLGKFRILAPLGEGTMGTVFRAEDPATGERVALKLVRSSILYSRERRERFLRDLIAISQIRHPALCPVLELGDDEDDFYLATPLQEDGDRLDALLRSGPLPLERALEIVLDLSDALAAVHEAGMVHRAVKPANVWIFPDARVLLTDCGVARFTEIEKTESRGAGRRRIAFSETVIPMAALAYMSPEQVRGDAVDHRSDIFSLGVLLYEMVAGRHPFEARNSLARMSAIVEANPLPLSSRRSGLPPFLDAVVRRATARLPSERYADINLLKADLARLRDGLGGTDLAEPPPEETARHSGRRQVYLVVSLALVLALILALAWFSRRG